MLINAGICSNSPVIEFDWFVSLLELAGGRSLKSSPSVKLGVKHVEVVGANYIKRRHLLSRPLTVAPEVDEARIGNLLGCQSAPHQDNAQTDVFRT